MKLFLIALCSVVIPLGRIENAKACAQPQNPTGHQETPEGFQSLTNGTDLSGWWGAATEDPRAWHALSAQELAKKKKASQSDIKAHWSMQDGVLLNDGHGLFLTTEKEFGDFELRLEYKTVPLADSGIYLRGLPQVQIWDTTEAGGKWGIGAKLGSGGLWNNSSGQAGKDPSVHADRPFGQWNSMIITMIGERVSVHLNEQLVVDHAILENYFDRTLRAPAKGPIQLQTHGGEIAWRNLFIREIAAEEANATLQDKAGAKFHKIFNGVDFDGWQGPTENYSIAHGALACKPGKGGTIYSQAEYSDFIIRMQFKLPPGGNNGLAIRYPGGGDSAYVGMCELQVLENTHPKYAELDARQYHGSVYGQVAAKRGYLRPVGSWNFQQVLVRGSLIQVELNGTRILDQDISEIKTHMGASSKFSGRERTRGHFGFAGHNDPVEFREITIQTLDGNE